jgi:hypothetical protein
VSAPPLHSPNETTYHIILLFIYTIARSTDGHERVIQYHGHQCHHISPQGGCPACHVHFCFACLATEAENTEKRGDRRNCRCPLGKWSTFCDHRDIKKYLVMEPYPHDSRCGCPICPDCRYGKPCGPRDGGSSCDGTCVVCKGLVAPGPLEITESAQGSTATGLSSSRRNRGATFLFSSVGRSSSSR